MTKPAAKSVDLQSLLEKILADFPPVARSNADPIQFPRRFFNQQRPPAEIEAVALFSAMLAYGSAAQFIKKIAQTLDACEWRFLELITDPISAKTFGWPAYRLSTGCEIGIFAQAIGNLILQHRSLKKIFLKGFKPENSIKNGLVNLRQSLYREIENIAGVPTRGTRHLLPDPSAGGCVKRWHMFLRWLVRPEDGVDMNLWPEVSPALLLIPLDRHISRIARNLGLTTRGSDDWKTAEEISASLARSFALKTRLNTIFRFATLALQEIVTTARIRTFAEHCSLAPACLAAQKRTKIDMTTA